MYKHILIATDGSELAGKAQAQGLELARALKAQVTVLTVTAPFPMPSYWASTCGKPGRGAREGHHRERQAHPVTGHSRRQRRWASPATRCA